jgi:Collagen triple helix repeat (20 copies)
VRKTILACVAVALIVGTTSATAATLITSEDIANGTIRASDIRKGTISENRLTRGVRELLRKAGAPGPAGQDGATVYGPQGEPGPQGPAGRNGQNGIDGGPGVQGAQGLKGDPGAAGPAGPAGPAGADGPKGDKGDRGDAGAKGDTGDRGADGAPGAKGDKGDRGEDGAPGAKGDKGDRGEDGAPGAKGDKGDRGEGGAPGAKGDKGDRGDAGAPGAKGDKGDTGANGLDADKPRVVAADLAHGVKLAPYGDNSQVDGRGNENVVDNGTITFAEPPLAPELGTRAARFAAKDGDPATNPDAGRSVVLYLPLTGRPLLSTLTYARYQSYVQDRTQAALDFAFKMEVFATGTGTYQTLVYEPYQNGSDVQGQWVEHNVLGGRIWSSRITNPNPCSQSQPCTFAEYLATYPNARVLTTKVMIGQNSGQGWPGFVGWLDDVRLGFNGQTVRYDLGG